MRACWDCGFESRREQGCLSLVSVLCCKLEVSAKSRSLVQRIPTDCGVLSVTSKPQQWGLGPLGLSSRKRKWFVQKRLEEDAVSPSPAQICKGEFCSAGYFPSSHERAQMSYKTLVPCAWALGQGWPRTFICNWRYTDCMSVRICAWHFRLLSVTSVPSCQHNLHVCQHKCQFSRSQGDIFLYCRLPGLYN